MHRNTHGKTTSPNIVIGGKVIGHGNGFTSVNAGISGSRNINDAETSRAIGHGVNKDHNQFGDGVGFKLC